LCQRELADGSTEINAQCAELAKDLTVVLDAKTEDTGILTYQYKQEAVLSIGYSPNGGSYEINLGGLKTVVESLSANDAQALAELPDTMQGAMRVTATVDDDTGVTAAGSMSLAVTQPLSIVDTDGDVNISLGNSELFKVSTDNNGNTKIASNFGALSASLPAMLRGQQSTATDIVSIMARSFTSQLDINDVGDEIKLGSSGSSFVVGINSGEAIRINVSNYGMTINSDGISIDPGLTLGTSLTSVISQYTDATINSASVNLSMPQGTVIGQDGTADAAKVTSGGFSYSVNANTPQGAFNTGFAANAGDCFGAANSGGDGTDTTATPVDSNAVFVKVDCSTP